MENKIGILSSFLHSRYDSDRDIGDDLADLEAKFNKLDAILLPMAEEMQVAILPVLLEERSRC